MSTNTKLFPGIIFITLTILTCLLLGMFYGGMQAAGSGLAGGAIVLSYGLGMAFIGLIGSLLFVRHKTVSAIRRGILLISAILLILILIVAFRISGKSGNPYQSNPNPEIGIGIFIPQMFDQDVLYFYGPPTTGKTIYDHSPVDSLVFKKLEHKIDITYAPPWFYPEYMKLDYDLLQLKAVALESEFVEVEVNKSTGDRRFVSRQAGQFLPWVAYLLQVSSVELLPDFPQDIKIKPLDYAGEVRMSYEILRPVRIKDNWMLVELQDENLKSLGIGWIKWRNNTHILLQVKRLS